MLLQLVLSFSCLAQTVVTYTYDNAGNRISRTVSTGSENTSEPIMALNNKGLCDNELSGEQQTVCRTFESYAVEPHWRMVVPDFNSKEVEYVVNLEVIRRIILEKNEFNIS